MADLQTDLSQHQGKISTLKSLSVALIVLGAVSVGLGIPTVILGALVPQPSSPFIVGTALYAGVGGIIAGSLSLVHIGKDCQDKCHTTLFSIFIQLCLNAANFHSGFSIWSLVLCSFGPLNEKCGGINWSANYLLAGVNMTIGVTIQALTIAIMCVGYRIRRCQRNQQKIDTIKM